MHKLEITGTTPEDLYMNAVRMLSVLLKGGATTLPAEPANDASAGGIASSAEPVAESGSNPGDADQEVIVPAKSKRGRSAKTTETKDVPLNDDISDVGGPAKTIEHEPQNLTLDGDIRPRLRAIQKAHAERIDPKTGKPHTMEVCVAYLLKLYGPFGIQKADQLKPESFAEFMEASEAYLSGKA